MRFDWIRSAYQVCGSIPRKRVCASCLMERVVSSLPLSSFSSHLTIAERCKHTIRVHCLVRVLEAGHSSQEDIQPLLEVWLQLPYVCRAEIGQESGAAHPVNIMVNRRKQRVV